MKNYFIAIEASGRMKIIAGDYLVKKINNPPKKNKLSKLTAVYHMRFKSRKLAKEFSETDESFIRTINLSDYWIPVVKVDSEICNKWILFGQECEWFIEKWFGIDRVTKLNRLSLSNKESELTAELESIWLELPDNIFNIIENPSGWNTFLSIIED